MRLDEGEQITKTPPHSHSRERFVATHLEQISDESKTALTLSESHSPPRDDYFAIVARATNDAVRDWNVKSGALSWPQGFDSLLGYGDLLLHERQIKGTLADHVTEIRAAAARASALTQQLLAFSRRQPLEPVIVEVNSIITNLERSLLRLIGENISVVCHLHHEKEGAHIKADPSQITQIILNLAVNARDAMPRGGQLTLETAIVDLTKEMESPFLCGDFVPGHYVLIKIADNGIGMSEEAKAHLFEPFFTTKTDQERSGLGLATCYD